MTHQTFYRKYRSQTFNEIVGQQHIVQTLQNAMIYDRLAHAYIFSGPRGTGKTSTARILAKALNCRNPKDNEPCLECDLCHKIAAGQAVDIIEMDAASNTGVDHIRVLNDQVNFTPVECPYRMFIIDEAHMLSTGAFNALLKTLEEPPPKTIFILATTEPHKIPATIHSRCQHLQFKKMPMNEMIEHLAHIAKSENITIDEKSLHSVARNATGCMRDGISLLEQLYAFKGNVINHEDVVGVLGSASFDSLYELIQALLTEDAEALVAKLHQLGLDGVNMMQLAGEISQFFKQLLYVKLNLGHTIDLDESRITKLNELSQTSDFHRLNSLLELFAKTEMDLRWFPNPELLLQVRFLSAIHHQHEAPLATPAKATASAAAPVQRTATPPPPAPTPVVTPQQTTPSSPAPTPSAPPVQAPVVSRETLTPKPATPAPKTGPNWDAVMSQLESKGRGYFALLKSSHVVETSDTNLVVQLFHDNKFSRDKLMEEKGRHLIESIIQEMYGKPLRFYLAGDSNIPSSGTSTEAGGAQGSTGPQSPTASSAQKINTVVAMFEGQILPT